MVYLHNLLLFVFLFCLTLLISPNKTQAIVDPLSYDNNKIGIHILFTEELEDATKLINSNGGDWGYVTIPIQAGDKDLVKWQNFMDSAKQNHVIPIIRLTTEGDYFTTSFWRKPNFSDVLDFANFLDSLEWPTANRYVVVFNEPNRNDEWGGEANASEYAKILNYAVEAFKSKNEDFFIISAGMDNASENSQYVFMQEMHNAEPKVFNQIDGIGSHSYPNPGFSQPPWVNTGKSVSSFVYEKRLADFLSGKDLPVFITETGWSSNTTAKHLIARYFVESFETVWSGNDIVAVTPFLFNAGAGPFTQFSLFDGNGERNEVYMAIADIPKTQGGPKLAKAMPTIKEHLNNEDLPTKDFLHYTQLHNASDVNDKVATAVGLIKWILRI